MLGSRLRWLVPLFGATKQDTSKNREIGWVLALGGRGLVKKSNNQPIVGENDAQDDGEGARLGQSVWGVLSLCARQQIERCKKYKNRLSWPYMTVLQYFTCNNQPKTRGWDGAGLREQVRPGGGAKGG